VIVFLSIYLWPLVYLSSNYGIRLHHFVSSDMSGILFIMHAQVRFRRGCIQHTQARVRN